MLTRRTLLRNAARLAVGAAFAPSARSFRAASHDISLHAGSDTPFQLPADFIGLGYEMSSVASVGLLSAGNDRYVQLIKQLGNHGVLRIGGIVADYTRYVPKGVAVAETHNTVITREALKQFGAFLKKSGWTAIWSVNFAQGTVDDAVTEATAVSEELGSSLQALEIGNEVENYAHNNFRQAPYTYEHYRTEYTEWRSAIVKALPHARFAAPDTASSIDWVEKMAGDTHGDVHLLTTHYYRNYQKQGSADQLMQTDPDLLNKIVRLRAIAQRSGIPWRLCETNSFSGGGLPGVSDTLLGALWVLDLTALLARYGCSGINIETGVNQLGFVSSYSPIWDDGKANQRTGAPYYGMLAFAAARTGCGQSLAVGLSEDCPGLTAYAFGNDGKARSLVVVNRSPAEMNVFTAALGLRVGVITRLSGPAGNSTAGVTFGGAAVDAGGFWAAKLREHLQDGLLNLPSMSAAVVTAA